MKTILAAIVIVCAVTLAVDAAGDDRDPALVIIEKLQVAFNAHDALAMARCVTSDVRWYSVDGANIASEAEGKTALIEDMMAYFEAIPTARSEIVHSLVSGKYVVVRERVFWQQDGVEHSQSSLALYEIEDDLIARVWYYPAER